MKKPKLVMIKRDLLAPHDLSGFLPTTTAALADVNGQAHPDETKAKDLSDQAAAFQEEFAGGILDPLDVCKRADKPGHYWILDGRHRVDHSTTSTFQARIHPAEKAREIILSKVLARRALTHGQRAWFLICANPEASASKPGQPKKECYESEHSLESNTTLRGLATRYGVRLADLSLAADVYRQAVAASKATKKDMVTDASLAIASGTPLERVPARLGSKAKLKEANGKRAAIDWSGICENTVDSMANLFRRWDRLEAEVRVMAKKQWRRLLAVVPQEVRDAEDVEDES